MISRIAGNGSSALGDGGLAINANLSSPGGVTVSNHGLYIADWGNNRVRFVQMPLAVEASAEPTVDFRMFPNPSTGLLNINFPNNVTTPTVLKVTDMIGHVVREFVLVNETKTQIVLDVPSGIYLVSVNISDTIITKKVCIIRS